MTEKRFEVTNISTNGMTGLFKLGNDTLSVYDVVRLFNKLLEENEELKQQKQQYKGQKNYLLFVIERSCSKELFEETKSYLKKVE